MMTIYNTDIPEQLVEKYMANLIGQFFKILPIKESGEQSLNKYMESLQRELIGCSCLVKALHFDQQFLSLISILQYLLDFECDVGTVRCEVFKAINICKKLQARYGATEV